VAYGRNTRRVGENLPLFDQLGRNISSDFDRDWIGKDLSAPLCLQAAARRIGSWTPVARMATNNSSEQGELALGATSLV